MAGRLYETALPAYRGLRRLKNRMLNLVDPPVVVLLYHRVAVLSADPHLLAVSPENFRKQMQFLKGNFPVLRFEADWSGLKAPGVVVTFDDGYADNALEALPVLEEVGIPATFFISTGNLGTRHEYWWDELERIILGDAAYPEVFCLHDREYGKVWPASSFEQRLTMNTELHNLIQKIGPNRRDGWLEQLRAWAGLDRSGREANRPLTPKELRTLAASPWTTIGAHTATHTTLSALPEDDQRQEILASKEELEELTGAAVEVFSYPFGTRAHYDRTSVRLCRAAGFRRAAANFPGQAHRWTDSFQIPRQLVRDWDVETFSNMMKGFWA